MTCIIGYQDKDRVIMGADTQGTDEYGTVQYKTDSKIFKKNGVLFGIAESHRTNQVVRYKFNIPERDINISLMEYMCTSFIDELMNVLGLNNCTLFKDNRSCSVEMIVGIENKLFGIDEDFHIIQQELPFYAIGSGKRFALGSLLTLEDDFTLRPKERIERALAVSAKLCSTVGNAPFDFIE